MPPEESLYPRDWLRIADKDWRRAERALEDADAEQAGFWLQQAVEKYLKAYLLSKGWELKRIHDLETLVNEAARLDDRFRGSDDACRKISGYYLAERYPALNEFSLTLDEVRESRNQIGAVVEIITQMFR
jgi:HEPN domain-containing protein